MRTFLTAAILALTASGCLTFRVGPESREVRMWSLGPSGVPAASPAPGGPALLVRDLSSSLLYETRDMVAVNDSGRVVLSTENRWVSLPAQMMSDLLASAAASTGDFGPILRGSDSDAGLVLDGRLEELGARRLDDVWYAVIRVETRLLDPCDGTVLHTSVYSRRSRLSSMEYTELASGLRLLAGEVASEAVADLAVAAGLAGGRAGG